MDLRGYKPSEELLRGAPCRALLRMSLGRARVRGAELRRLATSPDRAEQDGAYGVLETSWQLGGTRWQLPLRRMSKSQLAGIECPNAISIKSQLAGAKSWGQIPACWDHCKSPECELFAAPRPCRFPGFRRYEGTAAHCGDLVRCRAPSVAENPGARARASHFLACGVG